VANPDIQEFVRAVRRGDLGGIYRAAQRPGVQKSWPYRVARYIAEGERGKKYKTHVINCPPPALMWKMFRPVHSNGEFMFRAICRALWRERSAWDRIKLGLALLSWPPLFALSSTWSTRLNRRMVREKTGKSTLRQLGEQIYASWMWGCLPPWYYMFELYLPERFAQGQHYVHRFMTTGGFYRMLTPNSVPLKDTLLANKFQFAKLCRDNAITIPEDYVVSSPKKPAKVTDFPHTDVFVKPLDQSGGSGAQAWDAVDGGLMQSVTTGEKLTASELIARLSTTHRTFIIQKRLKNHDAIRDLSNGALATVRLMTLVNEHGVYEATQAAYRMAIGSNRLVDNFHAGGIVAKIDVATGVLGPASDIGLRPDIGWCSKHPDTGAQIEGRQLPFWAETVALACRAHAAFAPRVIVGWDIAITNDGPVIVEGNRGPDVDLVQRSHRGPLGTTRFAEILIHHLKANPDNDRLIGGGP
jgi:hypothetical protein